MNRLGELRRKKGLNMREVAKELNMPYTTYVNYEKSEREPNSEMLIKLATFFNVSVDYLIGRNQAFSTDLEKQKDIDNLTKYGLKPIKKKKFRMLGEIACGEPIYCNEDYETFVEASDDINADFCLTAKGDSMINARIYDGDVVFIKTTPEVLNGEIAAVIIDNEATLKRVYYYRDENKLVLSAENPKYAPLVYVNDELNNIRILGRATAFMSII